MNRDSYTTGPHAPYIIYSTMHTCNSRNRIFYLPAYSIDLYGFHFIPVLFHIVFPSVELQSNAAKAFLVLSKLAQDKCVMNLIIIVANDTLTVR